MAKQLSLTLGERLASIKVLNELKMNTSDLAVVLEDVKKFSITEEDWAAANLVKTPAENGTETWKWDENAPEKEIEIDSTTARLIEKSLQEKSDKNEFTIADVGAMKLLAKLK